MMKTIATPKFDQTINSYINTMYSYMFSIGNLSTYTVYDDKFLVAKPTILQMFLPFFKNYAKKINVDPKYYQKPNLFALDYYGAAELEWLVLFVSGIGHPVDFNRPIIDVLPISILNDLNKLITLYKKEVQNSKNYPESYTSKNIDINKQVGYVEKRYLYKRDANLMKKLISSASKNRISTTFTPLSDRVAGPPVPKNTNRSFESLI